MYSLESIQRFLRSSEVLCAFKVDESEASRRIVIAVSGYELSVQESSTATPRNCVLSRKRIPYGVSDLAMGAADLAQTRLIGGWREVAVLAG
jgi:hypothetical protein